MVGTAFYANRNQRSMTLFVILVLQFYFLDVVISFRDGCLT